MNVFPIYRKSISGKNWYQILSEKNFHEIQMIGSKYHKYTIEAKQYPEMLLIQDMIACKGYKECAREEYEEKLILLQT